VAILNSRIRAFLWWRPDSQAELVASPNNHGRLSRPSLLVREVYKQVQPFCRLESADVVDWPVASAVVSLVTAITIAIDDLVDLCVTSVLNF